MHIHPLLVMKETYQAYVSLAGMNDKGNINNFPFNRLVLGRILGLAKGEGNEMEQWFSETNGNVVPRNSAHPSQVDKLHNLQEF